MLRRSAGKLRHHLRGGATIRSFCRLGRAARAGFFAKRLGAFKNWERPSFVVSRTGRSAGFSWRSALRQSSQLTSLILAPITAAAAG
jgi:hypothetical protein